MVSNPTRGGFPRRSSHGAPVAERRPRVDDDQPTLVPHHVVVGQLPEGLLQHALRRRRRPLVVASPQRGLHALPGVRWVTWIITAVID
jgi:hypothetical protein